MARVLLSIQNKSSTLDEIQQDTRIDRNKIIAAVANLAYIGAIKTKQKDANGKALYTATQESAKQSCPRCLKGVNSIFNPKHTIS